MIALPQHPQSPLIGKSSPGRSDALSESKILIVDDEEANVRLLEGMLQRAQFDNYISTTDSTAAAGLFQVFQPDLVLTDWQMPRVSGMMLIEQMRALRGQDEYMPILVLTADATQETKRRALAVGATDFLTKPLDHVEVMLRIGNALDARLLHLKIQEQNAVLERTVRLRTTELERAFADLKATQQQVIQQERLAALGTMAGGIAHDFNNSLSIIMGFSELLLNDSKHGLTEQEAAMPLKSILTAADDASKIVQRLRGFYHPDSNDEPRLPVHLNHLIEQAISLTRPRWQTQAQANGSEIRFVADLRDIPSVIGDPAELREVFTNLIFNAVDALPGGGVITISTRWDGASVVVELSDTGTGMSEEVRRRCLEPFFTTKGEKGTGLGLAMVFGIIQRHEGKVDIASQLGRGTTFSLSLPAAEARSEAAHVQASAFDGLLHVLVVDDQPILCELLAEHLQSDLHTVETAGTGVEGLEKFRGGKFDLVITDQVMPEMNGDQFAQALKALQPDIPVILLTGFSDGSDSEADRAYAVDMVLGKPISHTALRQAITTVMTARAVMLACSPAAA